MMDTERALHVGADASLVSQLQRDIKEEIYKAVKISKALLLRMMVNPLINVPARNFSELMAGIDTLINECGLNQAANYAISRFCDKVVSQGDENIPPEGPLLIASNHPGTYDGLAILSKVPRNDVKVIVSGIPFFRNLPNTCEHLIYSSRDTIDRMEVMRKSIRHLKEGGALLIFPSGRIDPDPSVLPGAREGLRVWSKSVEVFMRKVSGTKLVLAITSGVLSKKFINHPLTRLFTNGLERRRVMEFLQVIRQMIRKEPLNLSPKITFAEPVLSREFFGRFATLMPSLVLQRAELLLDKHIDCFYANL